VDDLFLDTNAYSAYLAGDGSILESLGKAERIHLSLIVFAELSAGFLGGARMEENRRALEIFLGKTGVRLTLPTRRTAEYFALIKHGLGAKGRPIPVNDIWIAAQCPLCQRG
jgi:tRNA(fMet)-specific endonuclease VapC